MNHTAYDLIVDTLRKDGRISTNDHGDTIMFQCPAHNDRTPSLSVTRKDDRALLNCFAGCRDTEVLEALGLDVKDLFDRETTYDYGDVQAHRGADKRFSQSGNTASTRLFRVDELAKHPDRPVLVVEGEKDANTVLYHYRDYVGVSPRQGANTDPIRFDWSPLKDRDVLIVADNDEPGREHAQRVKAIVEGVAASVRVVRAATGKDLTDHRQNGYGVDDLVPVEEDQDTPEPLPLSSEMPIPPFPVDVFPTVVADMIRETAEALQVDPAMAGVSALSVLAACAGGQARIELADYSEPLNAYFVTVADPAERKSPTQNRMIKPLRDAEAKLDAKTRDARLEAATRKEIAEARAKSLKSQAGHVKKPRASAAQVADDTNASIEEAIAAAKAADEIVVPPAPRFIADDVTPEAITSLMAEQGGRAAVFSTEGGLFDIMAGRYSKGRANLDVWLKSHDGDPIKVDRKGRESESVEKPALTLGLMIQPAVLDAIAAEEDFAGKGLSQRILYALPEPMVGRRKVRATPVGEETTRAYGELIEHLAVTLADYPVMLRLSPAGDRLLSQFEEWLEPKLCTDLAVIKVWAAKLVGRVARLAGLLHLASGRGGAEVPEETVSDALRLGEYFLACAHNVFTQMGQDRVTRDAIYLRKRIIEEVEKSGVADVSRRDMMRLTHWAKDEFEDAEGRPRGAFGRLIETQHLLRVKEVGNRSTGRPPSPRYRLNPRSGSFVTSVTWIRESEEAQEEFWPAEESIPTCGYCGQVLGRYHLINGLSAHPDCERKATA